MMMRSTRGRCCCTTATAVVLRVVIPLLFTVLLCEIPHHCHAFQQAQFASRRRPFVFNSSPPKSAACASHFSYQLHVPIRSARSNTHHHGDEKESLSLMTKKRNGPLGVLRWLLSSRRSLASSSRAAASPESQQQQHPLMTTRKGRRLLSIRKAIRAFTVSLLLAMLLRTGSHNEAWAAGVTGGRMGGSFKPSTSRSSSSSPSWGSGGRSSSSYSLGYRPRPMVHYSPFSSSYSPQVVLYPRTTFYGAPSAVTSTPTNILILTGAGALLAFGAYQHLSQNNFYSGYISDEKSVLGPGATAASITVCLDVPNRNSPDSILYRLERLSEKVDTSKRKGVQDLISNVALELLRQEKSIFSGQANSKHFSTAALAEREFQKRSVESRSKFDRESVNKFGDQDLSEGKKTKATDMRATSAIVTIHLAIQGDSTKLSGFRFRADMINNLRRIASDSQVEDCLVAAEVDWTPSEPGETLSRDDVYADYPELIPL